MTLYCQWWRLGQRLIYDLCLLKGKVVSSSSRSTTTSSRFLSQDIIYSLPLESTFRQVIKQILCLQVPKPCFLRTHIIRKVWYQWYFFVFILCCLSINTNNLCCYKEVLPASSKHFTTMTCRYILFIKLVPNKLFRRLRG